ncbi:YDG domain-containing protein, partial [Limimaricola sp.]|uniref:YDG domain-containing protein n=1 Tax=Limimaricola sp. TaxID=2211665 RepID=UPI0025C56ED4
GSYTGIESVSALTGADAGNYSIGTISGDYEVAKLALTGSIATGSSTYGETLAPGAVSFANLVSGDTVDGTVAVDTTGNLSGSSNLKAGSYTGIESVSALTGADAGNYSIGTISGDYDVAKLSLTGTIATGSSTYGETLVPGAVSFTNVVSGDTVDGTVDVDTTGNESPGGHLHAGSYTGIENVSGLSGGDAGNYRVGSVAGDYDVSQRALDVSITGTPTKTFDQTSAATLVPDDFTLGNLASGDVLTVTQTAGTYAQITVGTGIVVTATLGASDFSGVGGTDPADYLLPGSATGFGTILPQPSNSQTGQAGINALTGLPQDPQTNGLTGPGGPADAALNILCGGVSGTPGSASCPADQGQ